MIITAEPLFLTNATDAINAYEEGLRRRFEIWVTTRWKVLLLCHRLDYEISLADLAYPLGCLKDILPIGSPVRDDIITIIDLIEQLLEDCNDE